MELEVHACDNEDLDLLLRSAHAALNHGDVRLGRESSQKLLRATEAPGITHAVPSYNPLGVALPTHQPRASRGPDCARNPPRLAYFSPPRARPGAFSNPVLGRPLAFENPYSPVMPQAGCVNR